MHVIPLVLELGAVIGCRVHQKQVELLQSQHSAVFVRSFMAIVADKIDTIEQHPCFFHTSSNGSVFLACQTKHFFNRKIEQI
eukprot:1139112-Amphidinium_carterae.1